MNVLQDSRRREERNVINLIILQISYRPAKLNRGRVFRRAPDVKASDVQMFKTWCCLFGLIRMAYAAFGLMYWS